jgi:maltooligosyltrehalose trehalohydrolase
MQKLLAAAVIVSPFLPMLFMGEEWSEPNPFLYFVSHTDPELAEAVRKGRKEEFASFHLEGEAPDPVAEETFQRSKLSWDALQTDPHKTMFSYYKALISLRKNHPALKNLVRENLSVQVDPSSNALTLVRWHKNDYVMVLMNFSKKVQAVTAATEITEWHNVLNSADPVWKGRSESVNQKTISKGSSIVLQPESVLIYSNNHV